jgi:hypothetical protein
MIPLSFFKSKLFGTRFSDPIRNQKCTELEINKHEISKFILKKLIPIVGYHPFPLDEQMFVTSAVTLFKPDYIFEWGTNIGKAARIFYEITKTFKISSEIHSIDLPDDVEHIEHPKGNRGMLVRNIKEVQLHQGDGLDTSLELYTKLVTENRKLVTLFFLDGDHEYSSVKRELEGIINNIDNPIILVHDTFYQSKESKYNIGPFQAIRDVLNSLKTNDFKVISTNFGLPGMTLLYRNTSARG